MPLPKVHEAPKTADFSTDSTLKTDNKSVEKKLAPDFWQFRHGRETRTIPRKECDGRVQGLSGVAKTKKASADGYAHSNIAGNMATNSMISKPE